VAPGGPADLAGLRGGAGTAGALVPGGDVITEIDGEQLAGPNDIAEVIGAKRSGDPSSVTFVRADGEHTVQVRLGSQPRR
jgi:S1-C subfamily serine protease